MRVLILANNDDGLYKFRKELLECLIKNSNKVYASLPYGNKIKALKSMGVNLINTQIDRRGINPITDAKLIVTYINIIKSLQPDVILTYTIKPNIYGALAARIYRTSYLVNITGLGSALEKNCLLRYLILNMYKISLKKSKCIFFQNEENMLFFRNNNIMAEKYKLIPGSGVNTKKFSLLDYPLDKTIEFVFISRIMKEKGIEHYLECAEYIRKKYPNTRFHICGFCEEAYQERLNKLDNDGVIIYHGLVDDIREILKITHCTIHPSYHEGMSNVDRKSVV